jgi:hypothetical protein
MAEKKCPKCGAKMMKYSTTTKLEKGKPVTKWACSMGSLCKRAGNLKRGMDEYRRAA